MNADQEHAMRKLYLTAIAEEAEHIAKYARKLVAAKHEQQCSQVELSEAVSGYEDANIVTYWPKLDNLREQEEHLQDMKYSFSSPFEV